MKVSVKILVQLDPGYRHSYGKCPQYAFQSKQSKNGAYRRNNYEVLYHRIPSKNQLLKVENKTVIEQTMNFCSVVCWSLVHEIQKQSFIDVFQNRYS